MTSDASEPSESRDDDVRDALPADLDVSHIATPYEFPDNSRRRIPAIAYAVLAAGCLALYLARRSHAPVLVNKGFLFAAVLLGFAAVMGFTSGWRLRLDEKKALAQATEAVGFPVGHASAQMAWRGLRSRPTWRVLVYSAEDPPRQRGFVLVDAIDGRVVQHLVEDNPEDWVSPS
jgi:hypothetical protein